MELNLSFNFIRDLNGIQELTLLKSLYLNHNRIIVIDSLEPLKGLKQLGLFHNQISDGEEALRVLRSLPKLKELSIDINPCSANAAFNFEIVLTLSKLKMFNEEAIRELDKDVAKQYFRLQGLPIPAEPQPASVLHRPDDNKENTGIERKKSVRFAEDNEEVKRLRNQVDELIAQNQLLQKKLDQKYFDEVYRENDRMKIELRNMEILLDENNDLKAEVVRLKAFTDDEKSKALADENSRLKRRNGELVIKVTDMEMEVSKLKKEQALVPKNAGMFHTTTGFFPRTQTAGEFEDLMPDKEEDLDAISTQLDRELEEMIAQN